MWTITVCLLLLLPIALSHYLMYHVNSTMCLLKSQLPPVDRDVSCVMNSSAIYPIHSPPPPTPPPNRLCCLMYHVCHHLGPPLHPPPSAKSMALFDASFIIYATLMCPVFSSLHRVAWCISRKTALTYCAIDSCECSHVLF